MKNYSIRLKDDQVKQLNKVADGQQRDLSFIIRAAIDNYLNKAPVMIKDKPTASESKPPKEVKQIKQPKKKETPKERPLSRSELFRSISKNRA